MKRPTPFVILTAPRTGSAWLTDVLNSHPQITAYGELFIPEPGDGEAYGGQNLPYFVDYVGNGIVRHSRLGLLRKRISYLNHLYGGNDVDCIGFKLVYKQAGLNPGLLTYLSLRRARVVHLIRSNLLDSVISWETAHARQLFHPQVGDVIAPTRVELDSKHLLQRLDYHEYAISLARSWIRNLRLPYTEAFYEELTGPRKDEMLARILAFLGVKQTAETLATDLVRANPTDHRQLLANYDEIRTTLTGSRFEWMLR
jgi:LPS sulfotransferase NodH